MLLNRSIYSSRKGALILWALLTGVQRVIKVTYIFLYKASSCFWSISHRFSWYLRFRTATILSSRWTIFRLDLVCTELVDMEHKLDASIGKHINEINRKTCFRLCWIHSWSCSPISVKESTYTESLETETHDGSKSFLSRILGRIRMIISKNSLSVL